MATTVYTTANENAALIGGRRPEWTSAASSLSATPDTAADGVETLDALVTHVHIATREDPGARTGYLTVTSVDDTATYRVTIRGTDHTYTATSGDTATEILAGLRAAINAGVVATASDHDSDSDPTPGGRSIGTGLRITSVTPGGCSMAVAAGGTGGLALVADAEGAAVQLFALLRARTGSTAPRPWVRWGDTLWIGPDGLSERVKTGGVERLFARVIPGGHVEDGSTVTTTALVSLGPALSEST